MIQEPHITHGIAVFFHCFEIIVVDTLPEVAAYALDPVLINYIFPRKDTHYVSTSVDIFRILN